MTLREQIEVRNRQWRLFHEWEKQRPPDERDPAQLVADIGGLLRWIPRDVLEYDSDPDKLGIAKMRAALALLGND